MEHLSFSIAIILQCRKLLQRIFQEKESAWEKRVASWGRTYIPGHVSARPN